MTRVSRHKLHHDTSAGITDHFLYLITSLTNQKESENFFESFLTKEEKIMLAKRLVLFMMLKKDYPPNVIQSALHVSYETVRTYSLQFTNKNSLFQQTIERILQRERTRKFWQKIEKSLNPLELFLQAKSNMRARRKLLSGDYS